MRWSHQACLGRIPIWNLHVLLNNKNENIFWRIAQNALRLSDYYYQYVPHNTSFWFRVWCLYHSEWGQKSTGFIENNAFQFHICKKLGFSHVIRMAKQRRWVVPLNIVLSRRKRIHFFREPQKWAVAANINRSLLSSGPP